MENVLAYRRAEDRKRARNGATMLAVAAVFHVLSIPAAIMLLKAFVELELRRTIPWDQFFSALSIAGVMTILLVGIIGQLILAVVAGIGAALLYKEPSGMAYGMIAAGIVGILFSFLFFGGIVGAIGGILSLAGGAVAMPKTPPTYFSAVPPPYYPPGPPPAPPGPP